MTGRANSNNNNKESSQDDDGKSGVDSLKRMCISSPSFIYKCTWTETKRGSSRHGIALHSEWKEINAINGIKFSNKGIINDNLENCAIILITRRLHCRCSHHRKQMQTGGDRGKGGILRH